MELKRISSPPNLLISLSRITPPLHCERRTFDNVPSRFLVPASTEGYLTLFSNDSNTILALDVATDDWCAMETTGYDRLADDAPIHTVCAYAKLYVIGQVSEESKPKRSRIEELELQYLFPGAYTGREIKIQCFDFATRKWSKVGGFRPATNAELITAAVVKKYGKLGQGESCPGPAWVPKPRPAPTLWVGLWWARLSDSGFGYPCSTWVQHRAHNCSDIDFSDQPKLSIFTLCSNGQLIEATVQPQLALLLSVRRSSTHNAPPLLNSPGATIEECANLKATEWKWLERRAFFDPFGQRLLWLGLSNCPNDTLHILDLSSASSRARRQWTSVRIPRNDRKDLTELGHRHVSRVAYLPHEQRLLLFLSEISEEAVMADALVPQRTNEPMTKTNVWALSLATLDQGWKPIGELPKSEISCVSGGDFNDLYCLNTASVDQKHKQQQVIRLFLGMPSLKLLSLHAVINALDPKTKRIQRKWLVEQLGKTLPSQVVEALWYRTKLDRGVLRHLSKGMGFYGEYAKDDDKVSAWKKLSAKILKR